MIENKYDGYNTNEMNVFKQIILLKFIPLFILRGRMWNCDRGLSSPIHKGQHAEIAGAEGDYNLNRIYFIEKNIFMCNSRINDIIEHNDVSYDFVLHHPGLDCPLLDHGSYLYAANNTFKLSYLYSASIEWILIKAGSARIYLSEALHLSVGNYITIQKTDAILNGVHKIISICTTCSDSIAYVILVNRQVQIFFANGIEAPDVGELTIIGSDKSSVLYTLMGTRLRFSAIEINSVGLVSGVALHASIDGKCKYLELNGSNVTCYLSTSFPSISAGDMIIIQSCLTATTTEASTTTMSMVHEIFPVQARVEFAKWGAYFTGSLVDVTFALLDINRGMLVGCTMSLFSQVKRHVTSFRAVLKTFVDIPAKNGTRIRGGILTDNNRFRASICTTTEASTTATTTDMLNFLKLQNSTIFFANLLKIKGTSNVNRRVVRGGTISVERITLFLQLLILQPLRKLPPNYCQRLQYNGCGFRREHNTTFGSNIIGLNGWYRIQRCILPIYR